MSGWAILAVAAAIAGAIVLRERMERARPRWAAAALAAADERRQEAPGFARSAARGQAQGRARWRGDEA